MRQENDKIVLHGRKIVGGKAEGEALVTKERVATWGGIDPLDGNIIEPRHELYGKNVKGKVLVFPSGKGSSSFASIFLQAHNRGNAPIAVINKKADTLVATAVILAGVPTLVDLDQDPCEIIKTGDWIKIDADNGSVEVSKRVKK